MQRFSDSFFLCFFGVLLISCADQVKSDRVTFLDFDYEEHEAFKWDDFVESTEVVRLEITDRSLISEISKVKYYHEKIFIFDLYNQVIFVFSELGKFQFRIDVGLGAKDEVTSIYDFDIHNDKIFILDHHKVKSFSLNGEFIEKIDIPVSYNGKYDRGSSFSVFNENTFFFWVRNSGYGNKTNQMKSRIWQYSADGELRDLGISSVHTGISLGNVFCKSDYSHSVIPYADRNEVHYLYNNGIEKKFEINFGIFDLSNKKDLSSSIQSDLDLYRLFTSGNTKVCGMVHNFIETQDFYFFSNVCYSDLRHNFIFKESQQRLYLSHDEGFFPYMIHEISTDKIVSHMTTEEVLNQMEKNKRGELSSLSANQKNLFDSLDDYTYNDNPVIILSKLRVDFL